MSIPGGGYTLYFVDIIRIKGIVFNILDPIKGMGFDKICSPTICILKIFATLNDMILPIFAYLFTLRI